jgi:carboxymethylenebutenolidase
MRSLLLVAALAACSSSPKPTAEAGPPPAVTDTTTGLTGAVTEEQFKAMHELPVEGTAQLAGTEIDLKGTRAYLSLPAGPGPFPAIVVIHEWWGLNTNVELWADRLASAGWAAIAVDLYGTVATTRDEAMAAMKAVDETKAAATITAAFDFAKTDPRIAATKRAVIGWCFGGGWSLKTALAHPDLDAAIMYYGQLELDPTKLGAFKGQLLGIFGEQDQGIPPAKVREFEAALKTANVPAEIHIYPADHAFANPSNPKYDQVNAAAAWTQVLDLLGAVAKK